jgi:hypothetical protein
MAAIGPEDAFFEGMKKPKPQIETWNIFSKLFEGDLPACK